MKNILTLLLLVLISVPLFAQDNLEPPPPMRGGQNRERLEQLEKLKLIEVMDLDEETTLKFFARRNEHRDNMRGLSDNRSEALKELQENVKDGGNSEEYERLISVILGYEDKIVAERKSFIGSLDDILTTEQIAKMMVFELEFKKKIREHLMRRGGRGPRK